MSFFFFFVFIWPRNWICVRLYRRPDTTWPSYSLVFWWDPDPFNGHDPDPNKKDSPWNRACICQRKSLAARSSRSSPPPRQRRSRTRTGSARDRGMYYAFISFPLPRPWDSFISPASKGNSWAYNPRRCVFKAFYSVYDTIFSLFNSSYCIL